ncbi:MAG: hypothetical protein MJK15_03090 [Colwellia sp.]|nr:hypothetical protein [Colwellia sp.]
MSDLQILIREVAEAKANIEQLNKLHSTYEANKKRNPHNLKMGFSVNGYNDCYAVCIDEDVFYNAVEASIAAQEKIMSAKFKTVEAMELLASGQLSEK